MNISTAIGVGLMTTRRIRGAAVAAALITGVAACSAPGGGSAEGCAADSVVIGVARSRTPSAPLLGYAKDGNSKIFDGLLARDATLKLTPALAKALPEVADNGLTYTYPLRDDVKFSDGEPLTSADVVFTYKTILAPGTNNTSRSELDAIKEVRADGDDKVVFTLKYPYAPFAGRTVLPIGTGPYVLAGWSKGEKLTFKADPDHWGGAPKVKKVTIAIVENDGVRATRLPSGDLDGAILPPNLAATFKNDRPFHEHRHGAHALASHRAVHVTEEPSPHPGRWLSVRRSRQSGSVTRPPNQAWTPCRPIGTHAERKQHSSGRETP